MSGLHQRRPVQAEEEIQPVSEDEGEAKAVQRQGAAARHLGGAGFTPAWPLKAGAVASLLLLAVATAWLYAADGGGGSGGLFTPQQLARYDGRRGRRVFVAVMGRVFDVTAGAKHYGPKGGYRFFAGKDASRAYVTGKFTDDLRDDVADFSGEQFQELARWRDFYAQHQAYVAVGTVAGAFYTSAGSPTPLLLRAEREAAAAAAVDAAAGSGGAQQQQQQQQQPADPPCNVKWSREEGGWVWCTDGRYPRRVARPTFQGEVQEQCACLEGTAADDSRRLYDGCRADAQRCQTSAPEAAAAR